jgi:hypothetical protein
MNAITARTVTRSIESTCETTLLLNILVDACNIPKWAPVFADQVELLTTGQYSISKDSEKFVLDVVEHAAAGTVDYLRDIPPGRRGGAYIRVFPRSVGGSVITMTLPIRPDALEADVAKILEQELTGLAQLAEASSSSIQV